MGASKCFQNLQSGEDISGKGYILKFLKLNQMPNGKARICMADGDGKEMGNLIVKKELFDLSPMNAGDLVEILKANKLTLKNGKPAYVIAKWTVIPAAPAVKKTPNPTTFASSAPAKASQPRNPNVTRLDQISPYSNAWEAEVRLLKRDPIREWNNARGTGKLQKLLISDDSGKMQMTLWKDEVDKFAFMEVDKVYRLSGANVKPADKKWNKTGMDYELASGYNTKFEEAVGVKIEHNYNFVKLSDLAGVDEQATVDICVIINDVEEASEMQSKTSDRMYYRRNIQVVDDSGLQVRCTLWGKNAEEFTATKGCALEVSGAVVKEWQGNKNLNINNDTLFKVRDEMDEVSIPETQQLFEWWNSSGKEMKFDAVGGGSGGSGGRGHDMANLKSVAELNALGNGDQADYADIRCWVSFFAKRDNIYYKACPETRKKVIETGTGGYARPDGTPVENPDNRMLMNSIKLTDTVDELWASAFHDEVQSLLSCTAEDFVNAEQNSATDEIFNKALFKEFIFRMRVKEEFYQDTPRKRFTIVKCSPVNYEEYNAHLLTQLQA